MEDKQKTVCILIHGWAGFGKNVWFPYLKDILEEKGVTVFSPDLPEAKDPTFPIWEEFFLKYLEENVPKDSKILFVCHSMGGYFLPRLIAKYPDSFWVKSIIAIIFAASPFTKRPEYKRMYDVEIDFEPIKQRHIKVIYYWSVDDPRVKVEHRDFILSKFNGVDNFEYHELKDLGHLCMKQFPELAERCLQLI